MKGLKPCPFCGGKVAIADYDYCWSIIASGNEPNVSCGCRLFMESESFAKNDILAKQRAKEKLIEKWNTRYSKDDQPSDCPNCINNDNGYCKLFKHELD